MIDPKLTPQQQKGLEKIMGRARELVLESQGWDKTCLSCKHFEEGADFCHHWKAKPPARTVVEACAEHSRKVDEPF